MIDLKDEGDRAYADSTCVSIKCILGAYNVGMCYFAIYYITLKSEYVFVGMSLSMTIHFQDVSIAVLMLNKKFLMKKLTKLVVDLWVHTLMIYELNH